MNPGLLHELRKVMAQTRCEKNYQCYENKFAQSCKVNPTKTNQFVGVEEEFRGPCSYKFHLDEQILCTCPVRIFAAKNGLDRELPG